MDRDSIRDALAVLPGVRLAYVFGSTSKGTDRPGSDLDLAVWTDAPMSLRARSILQERASAAAGRRIDLVDLRDASPLLRHQVIRDGLCVMAGDEDERASFEHRVVMDFLDTRHLRAVQHAYLRDRANESRVA